MADASPEFGELDGTGLRIGIAAARFNDAVTKALLRWAQEALSRHGVAAENVTVVWVPGAFELPLAALALAADHDAVICLGAVVRGETPHFDYVAGEAARGVQRAMLDTGVPVMFGVLTTDTMEQAEARSRDDESNKGYEAALGAIDMVATLRGLSRETNGG